MQINVHILFAISLQGSLTEIPDDDVNDCTLGQDGLQSWSEERTRSLKLQFVMSGENANNIQSLYPVSNQSFWSSCTHWDMNEESMGKCSPKSCSCRVEGSH